MPQRDGVHQLAQRGHQVKVLACQHSVFLNCGWWGDCVLGGALTLQKSASTGPFLSTGTSLPEQPRLSLLSGTRKGRRPGLPLSTGSSSVVSPRSQMTCAVSGGWISGQSPSVHLPQHLVEQTANHYTVLLFYSISLTQPDFTERNVPVTQAAAMSKACSLPCLPSRTHRAHTLLVKEASAAMLLTVRLFFAWVQRLYKAAGEDARHQYTVTLGLPEFARAKANADNLSEVSLLPR